MTAHAFLRYMASEKRVPYSSEKPCQYPPSSSEFWRWLEKGNVVVDGRTLGPRDEWPMPCEQITFFPKAQRRTTMPGFELCGGCERCA